MKTSEYSAVDIDFLYELDGEKQALPVAVEGMNTEARATQQPEPLFDMRQELARVSPQPDRLMAVVAARAPIIEAARPLLVMLARLPELHEVTDEDHFYRTMVSGVRSFQSVCQDAVLWNTDIRIASYVLCTALDEAVAHSPWATANEALGKRRGGRLSLDLQGANTGGEGFFLVLGGVYAEAAAYPDLLELLLLVLALGFKGQYRYMRFGQRRLGETHGRVYSRVRGNSKIDASSPRWSAIERMLTGYPLEEALAYAGTKDVFA